MLGLKLIKGAPEGLDFALTFLRSGNTLLLTIVHVTMGSQNDINGGVLFLTVLVALGNFLYTCFRKRNSWQVVDMSSK